MPFDEKLPRIIVVTVRTDDRGGWVLEVDGPDLDPWQLAAYLAEASEIAQSELHNLGSHNEE